MVEEEGEGDDSGARVDPRTVGEVSVGGLKDERGQGGILGAEVDGQGGSDTGSVDDDGGGRKSAGGGEIRERRGRIGFHRGFSGMLAEGLAVAAVVE